MKSFVLFVLLIPLSAAQEESCGCFCGQRMQAPDGSNTRGVPGAPGKRGPPGTPGNVLQCDCSTSDGQVCQTLREQRAEIDALRQLLSISQATATSCQEIKENFPSSQDGVYSIIDSNGVDYKVYCDMTTDGGGWTLVASVHENNIGSSGRCTAGDRWSSEQGRAALRPSGDGNWQNRNVFGRVTAATSDDYKNPAYFDITARNIMIWQVPDDTPLRDYNSSAYLKYRTTNGFLSQYGGNLFHLYSEHYPITSAAYTFPTDSGPAIPVVFDEGDGTTLVQHLPPNVREHVEAGYIQFRAISTRRYAFALCPGIRNKPTFNYPSQSCIGSTGLTEPTYCGDFSGWLHDGNAVGAGWSADQTLLSSTFFIFYR